MRPLFTVHAGEYLVGSQIAPNLVVSSQVYDWTGMLKEMIMNNKFGKLGGTTYVLQIKNGGLKIAYNSGYKLLDDVKKAGDAAIEGIRNGSIKVNP